MARRRDFMVLPKSRCSFPLSSEVGRRRAAEGTSKDRPEHSDQPNDGQRANNDWLPRADTLWHGKIDLRIGAARKDQTKTLRMIIENQDAPYFLVRSGTGCNERTRQRHSSIIKPFPFHSPRYGGCSLRRERASVGFYDLTREAITATSFGRAVLVAKGESDAPSDYNGVTEIPSFGIAS